jgi:hypothetical protein
MTMHVTPQAGHDKMRQAITSLGVHVSSNTQMKTNLWQVVLTNRLEQFLVLRYLNKVDFTEESNLMYGGT